MPIQVAFSAFQAAVDNYQGWCVDCHDFTRDCTEPDAEGYDCPVCENDTVMGAEQALLEGCFDIVEET